MTGKQPSLDYRSALDLIAGRMRGHWTRLIVASVIAVASTACELAVVYAVWRSLTVVVLDGPQAQLLGYALLALVAVLGHQVLFGLSTAASHLVAFDVIAEIRMALGRAWVSSPVGTLARRHSSAAKNSAIDQCERLELFIAHAIPETIAAVTLWLAVTGWLITVNLVLSLATVALVPVAFATMLHAMRVNAHRMEGYVQANADMHAAVVDFLSALPVIRAFNRIGTSHERTRETVQRTARLQSDWGRSFLRWGAPFSTLIVSGLVIIVPTGAWLYAAGQVDTASLLLFLVMGPFYPIPLVKIFYRLVALPVFAAGAKEILDEVQVAEASKEQCDDIPGEPLAPEVRFDRVSFSYADGEDVLHDVSFVVAAGKMTALVGASGAGKTTLAELLLGFHQPGGGTIRIGGRDAAELSEAERYRLLSAVFQRPQLRAGQLHGNIALARPEANPEQIAAVLTASGLDPVLAALPHGVMTQLGEGGGGLSGGEKQRVAIARALLADRPIVVLDEATAATDPNTELLIQRGLGELLAGRTSLVIAHRLRTVVHADLIVVLEAGRVVERGTHEELMRRGGTYARMWADHIAANGITLRAADPEGVR